MTAAASRSALDRRLAPARQVADAVLYEGYVLYPYRASAAKNQSRWQWGVLAPRPFAELDGSESWSMQTECLVDAGNAARLHVRLRLLQVQSRVIGEADGAGGWRVVPSLEVDGQLLTSWDEAIEHEFDANDLAVDRLSAQPHVVAVDLPEGEDCEVLGSKTGPAGKVQRRRWPVTARLRVSARPCEGPYPLVRVTVTVENTTSWAGPAERRDDVMHHSLVAVHAILAVDGGQFISSLDPPQFAKAALADCTNHGAFPVLVGDDSSQDLLLASPIILYDHPCVAPESEGDMFDATEIDEILALRVLTLTDDEKREARGTDPRAAAIIDRCDTMSPEAFARLHGTVRSLRPTGVPSVDLADERPWWDPEVDARFDPWTDVVRIGTTEVGKGTRVRLWPSRRADAQDLFVIGRLAIVQGVFHDVDNEVQLAVVLDDDPGADLHDSDGRYLYFHLDEIELEEACQ